MCQRRGEYGLRSRSLAPLDARPPGPDQDRPVVGGVAFDAVTEGQAVARVLAAISHARGGHVITPNVDILRQLQHPYLRSLAEADLVLADGFPVVLASRWQGTPLPERVTGSSLIHTLSAAAVCQGLRVFLLGGSSPRTGAVAADNLAATLPRGARNLLGHHFPPMGFERDEHELAVVRRALGEFGPHVVYVGLGFPKQDLLIRELRRDFPHTWFVGCGAAIAMLAGEVSRAPWWVQRAGLEWLYRLGLEPKRLYRRYIIEDVPFAAELLLAARRAAYEQRRGVDQRTAGWGKSST